MTYQALRLQLAGPIARIVLARPDAANRVDDRLLRELAEATAAIAEAEGVVLALLEAEGADFCRGWEESTRSRLLQAPPDDALVDPFGCLADLPCPVLAAVQGQARSAGLELALAADIRLCADDAVFSLPEVGYGHLPLAGGSQRLPRVVGRGPAAAVLLLGETLDAEAALRAGLVSRVFPRDQLAAQTQALAERIASRGPIALRYAKEAVHRGLEMTLDQGLRYELDLSIILQTTADRAEGVQAFEERRPPRFEGQ